MNMITIQPTYTFISPNNQMTGAGVTSEAVCYVSTYLKDLKKETL